MRQIHPDTIYFDKAITLPLKYRNDDISVWAEIVFPQRKRRLNRDRRQQVVITFYYFISYIYVSSTVEADCFSVESPDFSPAAFQKYDRVEDFFSDPKGMKESFGYDIVSVFLDKLKLDEVHQGTYLLGSSPLEPKAYIQQLPPHMLAKELGFASRIPPQKYCRTYALELQKWRCRLRAGALRWPAIVKVEEWVGAAIDEEVDRMDIDIEQEQMKDLLWEFWWWFGRLPFDTLELADWCEDGWHQKLKKEGYAFDWPWHTFPASAIKSSLAEFPDPR